MKIVTASGKKTLAMTREDWQKIGEKAGWLGKTACQCTKTDKVEAKKDEKKDDKLPDFLKKKDEEKKAAAVPETKVAATEKKPAVPAAKPPPIAGRTHVVTQGETLYKIAQRYYGSGAKWPAILGANRDVLKNENAVRAGMTLKIP